MDHTRSQLAALYAEPIGDATALFLPRQIDDLPGAGNKSVDGWQSTALRRYGLIGDFGLA